MQNGNSQSNQDQLRNKQSSNNMELKVGKYYRNRDGDVVKIADKLSTELHFNFIDEDGATYTKEGWYDVHRGAEGAFCNDYGLIEEVKVEEVEPEENTSEKLYTIQEIQSTIQEFWNGSYPCNIEEFFLKKHQVHDPEYKEYLRLKEKFSV